MATKEESVSGSSVQPSAGSALSQVKTASVASEEKRIRLEDLELKQTIGQSVSQSVPILPRCSNVHTKRLNFRQTVCSYAEQFTVAQTDRLSSENFLFTSTTVGARLVPALIL